MGTSLLVVQFAGNPAAVSPTVKKACALCWLNLIQEHERYTQE